MANEQQHHEHHHHHHHRDGASKFKRDSLMAIKRRKIIGEWLWKITVGLAIIMGIAVIAAYTIG
jgi:hypothetical protein